jgi:tRNA pseudouridine55 synthase
VSRFVLVDKPGGWTSHDVVAKIRGHAGGKVGHAGTLDPMATGLLVVALGRATRLLRFVQGLPKTYQATAVLGVATDTLDADGAVLHREPMHVSRQDVAQAMVRFVGPIMQVPPMVSARKVSGRRLYALAREGVEVEREPRPVEVYSLELEDFAPSEYPEFSFLVSCSTGTYVRSLADDIGSALGGCAHLTELRRLAIGSHQVSRASTMDAIEAAFAAGSFDDLTIEPAEALSDLPTVAVADDVASAAAHGASIHVASIAAEVPSEGFFMLIGENGDLLGVFGSDGTQVRAEVVTV